MASNAIQIQFPFPEWMGSANISQATSLEIKDLLQIASEKEDVDMECLEVRSLMIVIN